MTKGLVNHGKEPGCHSEDNAKVWKGIKQTSDKVRLAIVLVLV